jgi:quercetin dioxygenase-like cupin family protein
MKTKPGLTVKPPRSVTQEAVEVEGARGVKRAVLVSDQDGAPNFAMRIFKIEPGGYTPWHQHAWEHEVYIVGGHGWLKGEAGELELLPGASVFVPGGEMHQFRAADDTTLDFLCMIPKLPEGCRG